MSAELLLEFPGKVEKVFSLVQAPGTTFLKAALVIVQSDSVSVVHGENGSLYQNYNFGRKTNFGSIVDCIYLHQLRTFLVAFEDTSLVVVPLECKDVTLCERSKWPKQPLQLSTIDGSKATVYCEGGYVSFVSLAENGSLPSSHSIWSEKSIDVQSGSDKSVCYSNNRYVVAVSQRATGSSTGVTPAKRKQKSALKETETDGQEYNLSTWPVYSMLDGSCSLLSSQSATRSTVSVKEQETLVDVVCHAKSDSLSFILSSPSSGRWVKLALDGTVLFERHLQWSDNSSSGSVYCTEVEDQLCVLGSDRVLRFYDIRYGTEIRSISLVDSTSASPVSASWLVRFESDVNKAPVSASALQLINSKLLKSTGPCNLYRRALPVSTENALSSSLCQSIGKLSGAGAAEVPAALPVSHKRQLQELQAQYAASVQQEVAQDKEEVLDSAERRERKQGKLTVDVPHEAAKEFMTRLESKLKVAAHQKVAAAVEDWEWDLLKLLARSGDLSVTASPNVLGAAAQAKRLDVLAAVVQYVPDLSERQCVKVLALAMLLSEDDVKNLSVVDGVLVWSASAGAQPASKAAETKKGKKSSSLSIDETVVAPADKVLDVVRALLDATLQRTSAFSTILLSEAVRILPLHCAVLLLRLVTHFMRGLCTAAAPHTSNSNATATTATDEHMKRAAVWVEALLDGHFSALALHAVSHAATRRALTYAMTTIRGAEEAAEQVQTTLGLWTHINRIIHNGGQQVKPITSLYQVEHLDLR